MLGALPAPMVPILRLLAETGMREAKAVNLEERSVDRVRHQITLTRTKSGHPRSIAWSTPGGDAGRVLDQHPVPLHGGPLFLHQRGETYRQLPTDFGNAMRRLQAEAEDAGRPFKRWRIHDLRHRFAISWLKAGGSLHRLSRHLGHSSVRTTESYLRYLTSDEMDRVLNGQKAAQPVEVAQNKNAISIIISTSWMGGRVV